jgi:hypothetical protein
MIFYKNTYNKTISIIILSAYILASVLSLLHYHQIDLYRPNAIEKQTNYTFTGFGTFDNQNFICTIHQNFSLLHNTGRVDIADHSPNLQNSDNITFSNKERHCSYFYFSNINLRAPPIST